MMPSIERLHAMFDVRDDGTLVRKVRAGRGRAGEVAGYPDGHGYLIVSVDTKRIHVHRVVYAMTRGRWPENEVDHIDGRKSNNSPANLRDVNRSQNMQNITKVRSDNQLGFKGVTRGSRDKSKFRFMIQTGGKRIAREGFATPEAAHEAYKAAKIALHSHAPVAYGVRK